MILDQIFFTPKNIKFTYVSQTIPASSNFYPTVSGLYTITSNTTAGTIQIVDSNGTPFYYTQAGLVPTMVFISGQNLHFNNSTTSAYTIGMYIMYWG